MAEQLEHPLNRHLFIADNLNLLRALDNESVDLICIDPPFAKNQTFTGSLRPPLSDAERQREAETLAGWGIRSQRDAQNAGIDWPDADNTGPLQRHLALGGRCSRGLGYAHRGRLPRARQCD